MEWSRASSIHMTTPSNGKNPRYWHFVRRTVTGGFPSQRPVTQSVDAFFDLHLNKRSRHWWFEALSRPSWRHCNANKHYWDDIMGLMASLITRLTSDYSIVHSGADQRKHQSSASLAFVRGIRRKPVNSPHKWPVTRKMFQFDDGIMKWADEPYLCSTISFTPLPACFKWTTKTSGNTTNSNLKKDIIMG